MSCGVLSVKVYICVARSLPNCHGNWSSMLEVSGRQRGLDEPCKCGRRDRGEREGVREWNEMEMEKSKRDNNFVLLSFFFFPPLTSVLQKDIHLLSSKLLFPLLFALIFSFLCQRTPPNKMSKRVIPISHWVEHNICNSSQEKNKVEW